MLSRVSWVWRSMPGSSLRSFMGPVRPVMAETPDTKSQLSNWTARSKWPTGGPMVSGL